VGGPRKIAMDEAARRLITEGIILCLDADCSVSTNYLQEIYQHFQDYKHCDAASIFVEHPVDDLVPSQKEAIIKYELHLRYLIHAQRWCGHPFAFHTIGSAMAVRRKAYMNQGGMNTRRAGEDFYFLQKFIEIGSHMDLNNATVYPSARISERVPFGTGKAMKQILEDEEQWLTTDFEIFASIRPLFQSLDRLRTILLHKTSKDDPNNILRELELSDDVIHYLEQTEFLDECWSIAGHTASVAAFKKRFFRFFNAFRMIKFMHYMSDHHFPDIPVLQAVVKLKVAMKWSIPIHDADEHGYLKLLRSLDRENG
jgi:cellulose synthase/poly-beta-1,6-N-acetylglucosamine synthase-like glycosyltransferase